MQTWHGAIAMKPLGKMRGKSFSRMAQVVSEYDAKLEDCFLNNSKYSINMFRESFYDEPPIKIGSPRCDILVNNVEQQRERIRKELNLPQDIKLIMYAPTFRGGSQSKVRNIFQENVTLNFKLLQSALIERFGGKWHILLRLHPQLALRNNEMQISDDFRNMCTDISLKDDMYEYLAGVDSFVTDYSSAAFDAAIMHIPIFVYADDLDDYIRERGKLIRNIYEYPFSVARTNEELQKNILDFDEAKYLDRVNKFFTDEDILEDGHASERAADIIQKHLS